MILNFLIKPAPLYAPVILLVLFIWKCFSIKRWPGADKVIELLVIGGAFHWVTILVLAAWNSCPVDINQALGNLIGAAAIGYVSSKQGWSVFRSIEPDPIFENKPKASPKQQKGKNASSH